MDGERWSFLADISTTEYEQSRRHDTSLISSFAASDLFEAGTIVLDGETAIRPMENNQ
jgi:hypothetical protein